MMFGVVLLAVVCNLAFFHCVFFPHGMLLYRCACMVIFFSVYTLVNTILISCFSYVIDLAIFHGTIRSLKVVKTLMKNP